jgi:regulator of sigma E protease
MLIFLIVIIGLSILILSHEAGHFFAAKLFNLKIDEFGFGFPPKIFSWRPKGKISKESEAIRQARGETEYSLNWLPFGGFVRIAGENDRISGDIEKLNNLPEEEKKRYFLFQPAWKRGIIILAGVLVNFVTGWLLLSAIFMIGTPKALIIGEVQSGSPAEQAGLSSGDIIKNFESSNSFSNYIKENKGQKITLPIIRGGREIIFNITLHSETNRDNGALGIYYAESGLERVSPPVAIWEGLKTTVTFSKLTIQGFYELGKGLVVKHELASDIVGPVGVFSVAQEAGSIGFIYVFQLISLISINLAVINLIPFPALDGGRFFLILIEKIKGSAVSIKTESWINGTGFALLIALMILITIRDVIRLF